MKQSNLIGKTAEIKSGMYAGEWGIIKAFDGEYYHIGLWGDDSSLLIYERNEFKVRRETK